MGSTCGNFVSVISNYFASISSFRMVPLYSAFGSVIREFFVLSTAFLISASQSWTCHVIDIQVTLI